MANEAITYPISAKKKIDKVNKTEKPQAPNKKVDTHRSNKTYKVKAIDKSRSTKKSDIENKVNRSRYIPRTNLSNISTRIGKTSGIDIHKDNLSVSVLSGHGESLSSVTPDTISITRKNKRKKTPDTLIIRKQPIKEPVNPKLLL